MVQQSFYFFIRNEENYIKRRKDTRERRDTREREENKNGTTKLC